jgi:hypothetical protein
VSQSQLLSRAFARFDPVALGVAMGVVAGGGLFFLTAVLLVRGGEQVGLHLNRLSNFLIGFEVTWLGAFVGAAEAGVLGFMLGAGIAFLWNGYHRLFVAFVVAREQRRENARELQGL